VSGDGKLRRSFPRRTISLGQRPLKNKPGTSKVLVDNHQSNGQGITLTKRNDTSSDLDGLGAAVVVTLSISPPYLLSLRCSQPLLILGCEGSCKFSEWTWANTRANWIQNGGLPIEVTITPI